MFEGRLYQRRSAIFKRTTRSVSEFGPHPCNYASVTQSHPALNHVQGISAARQCHWRQAWTHHNCWSAARSSARPRPLPDRPTCCAAMHAVLHRIAKVLRRRPPLAYIRSKLMPQLALWYSLVCFGLTWRHDEQYCYACSLLLPWMGHRWRLGKACHYRPALEYFPNSRVERYITPAASCLIAAFVARLLLVSLFVSSSPHRDIRSDHQFRELDTDGRCLDLYRCGVWRLTLISSCCVVCQPNGCLRMISHKVLDFSLISLDCVVPALPLGCELEWNDVNTPGRGLRFVQVPL